MRKLMLALGVVVLVGLGAAAQFHYAFYYDTTSGQDVEINLMNPMFNTTDFEITVYNAFGVEIWSAVNSLTSAQSGFLRLGENIPYDEYAWGVVTVESTDRLIIGVEYLMDGQLVSVDTVVTQVPELLSSDTYWLGTYYSQVADAETGVIVMNPWPVTTACTVTAYNSQSYSVYTRDFVLAPHESEYVNLTSVLGSSNLLWGLLDVSMHGQAVVLAVEYYGRGASGLEIDNVTEYYY